MIKEFKKFIMRGNMIDLAVGMIIGTAFNGLVSSLVNDIFMPLIGVVVGDTDFSNMYVLLSKLPADIAAKPATLAEAKELGLATLNYGAFITGLIHFFIMAIIVFLMVKAMNKVAEIGKKPEPKAAPTTKKCPFCFSEIDIKATKCPHCTSEVPVEEEAKTE